ncbi:MAG: HipA domain-containing protein, partial [Propionicimonas sp.]
VFQVVDISDWAADSDEELGARDKLWVSSTPREDVPDEVPDALWKEGRPGDKVTEARADLWAEKIAAEIAALMGVPAAKADLAERGGVCGVLSWRMAGALTHGNQLLSVVHADYQAQSKGRVAGYDLPSIERALEPYGGWDESLGAFDCFAGLLVLDALIANTDRHHENWGIIEETRRLAPSYDHGASLGFNVRKPMRERPREYAAGGKSRHFPSRLTLVDLAGEALGMVGAKVAAHWREAVARVDTGDLKEIIASVPEDWMSGVMRTFVLELVIENRRRLLT